MANQKKLTIVIILLLILSIALFTIALDFSRFFGLNSFYNLYPSFIINRINVLLAAALVWLAGKDSLSHIDNRLMKLIFALMCLGEPLFLLAKPAAAITIFALCQSLLIFRHSSNLIHKLYIAPPSQKIKLLLLSIILAGIIIISFLKIYSIAENSILSIAAVSYLVILSISLWTAAANYTLQLFPKVNSKMIAIGMVLFFFCDISVGLDVILPKGTAWLLANSLIWVFYTPAITLLALSSYNYNNKSGPTKTRALK